MIAQFRSEYAKSGEPLSLSSERAKEILQHSEGEYSKCISYQYRWDDKNMEHRVILKIAMKDIDDGELVVDFNLVTGTSKRKWFDH